MSAGVLNTERKHLYVILQVAQRAYSARVAGKNGEQLTGLDEDLHGGWIER